MPGYILCYPFINILLGHGLRSKEKSDQEISIFISIGIHIEFQKVIIVTPFSTDILGTFSMDRNIMPVQRGAIY